MAVNSQNSWNQSHWDWETWWKYKNFTLKTKIWGIRSFEGFLNIKKQNPTYYKRNLWALVKRLESIQLYLNEQWYKNIDPIEYLAYLYFDEQASTRDISDILRSIWIRYNETSVGYLFWKILGWNLRDQYDDKNKVTKKKNKAKYRRNAPQLLEITKNFWNEKRNLVTQWIVQDIQNILWKWIILESTKERIKEIKKWFEKVKVIFSEILNKDIYDFIKDLSNNHKPPTISLIINTIVKTIWVELGINGEIPQISKNTIVYILKK